MKNMRVILCLVVALLCSWATLPAAVHAEAAGKKVVVVVPQSDFEDTEYKKTCNALEDAGVSISVAAEKMGQAKGQRGTRAEVAFAYADVQVADFDAVVFIGGKGSPKMVRNPAAQRIAKEAMDAGMLVGAICYSPVILARAGVVQGRTLVSADCWGAKGDLKRAGARWKKSRVYKDGNLITANGPKAAGAFGDALVDALAR